MREKITVLIADDNQEFSTTLATYLKNQEDMVSLHLKLVKNLLKDHMLQDNTVMIKDVVKHLNTNFS